MAFSEIKALISALPGLSTWPELAKLFDDVDSTARPDWELPLLACEAVGGSKTVALYAAAAIACLQISIILVDDILDDDPRGAHHLFGTDRVANMALAYESAAILLGGKASQNHSRQGEIMSCLAKAALETAAGQRLDVLNLQGEEHYWAVVSAKSTPFYGAALQVGALAGNADSSTSERMNRLGVLIGEMIQLEDDLIDALKKPANADWNQGRNNLLIMFARTAEHRERDRFLELLPLTNDPKSLAEAQSILISSGAVSYCAYQLVHRQRIATTLLDNLNLENPDPLRSILTDYGNALKNLLQVSGVELSISDLHYIPN